MSESRSDDAAGQGSTEQAALGEPSGLRRALDRLEDGLALGSGLFAVAIMVFTTRDAVGRYLFGAPLQGTYEIVERLFMVGLVFLAAARTERLGRNVSVRVFVERFAPRRNGALARLVPGILTACLWGYVAWAALERALERWSVTVTTTVIAMPRGLSWLLLAVGAAFLALRILITGVQDVLRGAHGSDRAAAQVSE